MLSPRRAVLALLNSMAAAMFMAPPSALATPAPVFPLLPHELFDVPIRANGYFGDHRNTHFHAGLDLDTGGKVGRAVHAPADAEVKRVRASGVGYGRSIYLEMADGRLLVFGHLDAFAEPISSYVEAVQDSSGQYEQDLWPPASRYRVRAGDIIGWTGRSGTGGPHLHVEIRRGDMAINPLLAGYSVADTSTPRIMRVTLAPLDENSFVQASPTRSVDTPYTLSFGARDTVRIAAMGRFRLVVDALDAESDGTYDVSPWRLRVTNGSHWIECEFDSASWATDMSQSDFVYDSRRYTDRPAMARVLAAPLGFRSRVIRASEPEPAEAGVVTVSEGTHDVVLSIEAEDLAGHVSRRFVRLAPTRRSGFLPVHSSRGEFHVVRDSAAEWVSSGGRIDVPAGGVFESTDLEVALDTLAGPSGGSFGSGSVGPQSTPLAIPVTVAIRVPNRWPRDRVCLYGYSVAYGKEFIGARYDTAVNSVSGTTRHLGNFRLERDIEAPTSKLLAVPRTAARIPYPHWAIEAKLADSGSGVDSRETYFIVDGHRVPSEWDSVIDVLRWKPLRTPVKGRHTVQVVATDHVGNVRKTRGAFVVD